MEIPGQWARVAIRYSSEYARTNKLPQKSGALAKTYSMACCPLVCGACCLWSTLFRVIACPFQCICNGAQASCSNNSCTTITDACVGVCFTMTFGNLDVPILCKHNARENLSQDDLTDLIKLVDTLLTIYIVHLLKFQKMHYDIMEKVVVPLIDLSNILYGSNGPNGPNGPKSLVPANARPNLLQARVRLETLQAV